MSQRSMVSARCSRNSIRRPTSKTYGTGRSRPSIRPSRAIMNPVSESVLQVNGFLRGNRNIRRLGTVMVPDLRRTCWPLPNQIQTRNYGLSYYVVITPSAEPRIRDIRHAYLHFLLDPYATRHEELVMRSRGLSDHAQRAQALDPSFKSDYLLLFTESLIKAIEARASTTQPSPAIKPGHAGGLHSDRVFRRTVTGVPAAGGGHAILLSGDDRGHRPEARRRAPLRDRVRSAVKPARVR